MSDKKKTTLEDVQDAVEYDDLDKWDLLLDPKEAVFAPVFEDGIDGRLTHPMLVEKGYDDGLELNPWARQQLCTRLGIPRKYLEKCSPSLQSEQLNYWMTENFVSDQKSMFLRCRGGSVRGILSDKYTPVDNIELVKIMGEALEVQAPDIDSFSIGETSMHVRMSYVEDDNFQVMKDDPFGRGFHITNSEVGAARVGIFTSILRLVCTNGLIAWQKDGDEKGRIHVGRDKEEILEWFTLHALDAAQEFDAMIANLSSARSEKVEINEAIPQIEADLKLSAASVLALMEHYAFDDISPAGTRYRVVNAMTRLAKDMGTYDRRFEVESYASRYLMVM